jgi:CheY-like chemotaxis protein
MLGLCSSLHSLAVASKERMKILIVEDDHLVREVAVEILRDEGFEVIEAATAEEGLERCAEHAPDLLFTDIRPRRAVGL